MTRFRLVAGFALVTMLILSMLLTQIPAQANVTKLVIHRRTCGTVSAWVVYDSFSEGTPPFWAVFAVDLNGNGVYGEADEPLQYVKLAGTGEAQQVGTVLAFKAVPEGSTISVTAYEVDSAGTAVSKQLPPVSYACTHRPALDPQPPNTGIAIPGVGIVAKINVRAITVYSAPNAKSEVLGGLGRGAFVNVRARNQRGDWFQIEFRGQLGWIMWQTQALIFGPYSTLPVTPNVDQPTPIPTLGPTATRAS
ncbi:MAG: SH3 domain-containing protein [Anaerolineae bacterium]|nr:SH3 domain-containing protein [Anaerolineae bacterium]